MTNVYGSTPADIEANKATEDARRLAEFETQRQAWRDQLSDWQRRLIFGEEIPQAPAKPRPIPR